jgi:hypothetical protein
MYTLYIGFSSSKSFNNAVGYNLGHNSIMHRFRTTSRQLLNQLAAPHDTRDPKQPLNLTN